LFLFAIAISDDDHEPRHGLAFTLELGGPERAQRLGELPQLATERGPPS
jgi:hypothetical protein